MRSHLFPLPLPPKHHPHSPLLVQDRESETESRNSTRKRSTRTRKIMKVMEVVNTLKKPSSTESVTELDVVSSVCNDTSSDSFEDEEDVASCLMMMARDKWRFKSLSQTRARYECETCKKVFGSFQALGGHRTSHKKVKKRLDDQAEEKSLEEKPRKKIIGNKNVVKKLMHECPVCFKVFGSGQALGGHKRSHFLGSSSTTVSTSSSTSPTKQQLQENGKSLDVETKDENFGFTFIDLNLPAPMEYEDSSPLESLHLV